LLGQGFLTWCKEATNNLLISAIGTKLENKSNQFTHRIRKKRMSNFHGYAIEDARRKLRQACYGLVGCRFQYKTDRTLLSKEREICLFGQLNLER
jgi:hypothetical protein